MKKLILLTVMLWPGILLGQDKAIITTTASAAVYEPDGDYDEKIAQRKPAGVNTLRGVLDRLEMTNPDARISWGVWYSMDEGQTWNIWAGAATRGGVIVTPNGQPARTSSFRTSAPPEGALILNRLSVTGGSEKFSAVLQLWEAR
jgi:hypothetical protein